MTGHRRSGATPSAGNYAAPQAERYIRRIKEKSPTAWYAPTA
jgi:hypothetical protein